MSKTQQNIRGEYDKFVRNNVNCVGQLIKTSYHFYPDIVNDGEIVAMNMMEKEARSGYLFDLFMRNTDGCVKMKKVLTETTKLQTVPPRSNATRAPVVAASEARSDDSQISCQLKELTECMKGLYQGQQDMKQMMKDNKESLQSDIVSLKTMMEEKIESLQTRFKKLEQAVTLGQATQKDMNDYIVTMLAEIKKLKAGYESVSGKINKLEERDDVADLIQQFLEMVHTVDGLENNNPGNTLWKEIKKLWNRLEHLSARLDVECTAMQNRLEARNDEGKGSQFSLMPTNQTAVQPSTSMSDPIQETPEGPLGSNSGTHP